VTFGFGNQHSIQLSYGRLEPRIVAARHISGPAERNACALTGIMCCLPDASFHAARSGLHRKPEVTNEAFAVNYERPMSDQHSSPIKTWQQLVVVVVAAFVVPVIVIAMLAALITSGKKGEHADPKAVAERIRPVGTVQIAGPRVTMSGEQVYEQVCKTCHGPGLAGAPKFGDKAAWAKVIKQGEKLVFAHSIQGIRGMPPKGGNSELSDNEVYEAVLHMINAAGAKWKMPPPAPAATATASATPSATPIVPVTIPPPAAAAPAGKADGKNVYETACAACHAAGVAGAPKFGDKAAWAPRLTSGKDMLYASSIKGKGAMPPKGGQVQLPDDHVKAAVDYMTAAVR
jgi:cytochrome c5